MHVLRSTKIRRFTSQVYHIDLLSTPLIHLCKKGICSKHRKIFNQKYQILSQKLETLFSSPGHLLTWRKRHLDKLDVKSLYSNIPIKGALKLIAKSEEFANRVMKLVLLKKLLFYICPRCLCDKVL